MGKITYLNVLSERTYPSLALCKPTREIIHYLKDIYGLKLIMRVNDLNEISFTIPTTVTRRHKIEKNPLISLIKDRYYIKMDFEGQTEYFLVLDKSKQLAKDGTTVSYKAFSCAIELADKDLREYLEESKNLSHHAREMLTESEWKLDYVDVKFDLKYRTLDISSSNILESLFELKEKFNALVTFDTVNRTVSFYDPSNYGINRGARFTEGRFLDSLTVQTNAEEIVTRLKVYGQDGLEFRNLSPTGSNYIEDFSFFMYPFECDVNYNVLKSSYYMTDELCIAITKYKNKLSSFQGQFDDLVQRKKDKQNEIQIAEQALSVLESQRIQLEDSQWVINATYQDEAPNRQDWLDITNQLDAKKLEIQAKENEIADLNIELTGLEHSIIVLNNSLKVENNYSPSQLTELNKYIVVKHHSNDSIVEEDDLWEEAWEVFETYNEPPLNVNLSVEGYVESIRDRIKPPQLSLGDIATVESDELNIHIKVKTIEISIDFDADRIDLQIANGKDIVDVNSQWEKVIKDSTSTSTTLNMEKYKYRKGENAYDDFTRYLNHELDTAKQTLVGGYQNTTTLNHRGLYSQHHSDANTYLVINNGILAITKNNGNSVEVAISANGVHAEKIAGRLLLGSKLHIEDEEGIVTIANSRVSVFDDNGNLKVELGKYADPSNSSLSKYGLRVYDGSIDLRTNANANRGVQFDSNGFRSFNNNGVRTFNVDSTTGKVEIIGSMDIRTSGSSNRGVSFDGDGIRAFNSSGTRTFYVDTNGNLTANSATITGQMTITGGSITGDLNVSGTLTGGNIKGTNISGTSISGGTINGTDIRGSTITGALIKTNEESNRGIVFDSNGINGYDANGNRRFTFDAFGNVQINGLSIGRNQLTYHHPNNSTAYLDIISNMVRISGGVSANGNSSFSHIDATSLMMQYGDIDMRNTTIDFSHSNLNFTGANTTGLSVSYATSAGNASTATTATNANYATSAGSANSIGGITSSQIARTRTNGLEFGYSSSSNNLWITINGVNVAYIVATPA